MLSLKEYIKQPRQFGLAVLNKLAPYIKNDALFLKMKYWLTFGVKLDLKSPRTFNQKLQWLKLYNRKPKYIKMVDKYAVKEYVSEKLGKEFIIPTLGVWNTFDEIDFESLPNQFVLKTTHGGGGSGVVICREKSTFDKEKAKRKLTSSLNSDIYTYFREWPYKDVPRRIIAEQYMEDNSGELKDYKFFCFDGKVEFCKVDFGQFEHHANYYSPEWSLQTWGEASFLPDFNQINEKPESFDKMIALAQQLAKDIPFARIDLYNIKERTYFGEITFYPARGLGAFEPMEADAEIGQLLQLPNRGGYLIDNQNIIIFIHTDYDMPRDMVDYKFFCFDGDPRLCQVISDRHHGEKIDFFDKNWHRLIGLVGLNDKAINSKESIPCPTTYEQMKRNAAILSKDIPFVRIDQYEINGRCYFGEITFYPASGMGKFTPDEWNEIIGNYLKLPFLDNKCLIYRWLYRMNTRIQCDKAKKDFCCNTS